MWWSVLGNKLFEGHVASPDFVVHLEWSVSGKALWMCGISTLSYVEVKKIQNGMCAYTHVNSTSARNHVRWKSL